MRKMWFHLLWSLLWLRYSVSTLLENGDDLFTVKFLTINGRLGSLQDIYGLQTIPVDVSKFGFELVTTLKGSGNTEISLKLPDIDTKSIAHVYIDREFTAISSGQSITTPSDIVQRFLDGRDQATKIPLTILVGDVSAGKSVALLKLAREIDQILQYAWIIRIDVAEEFPTSESTRKLTFENIIEKFVKPSHTELFKSVLRYNPNRIFIFLDNVDNFVAKRTEEICATIQQISASGATIVVATHPVSVKNLNKKFNPIVYELREISLSATKSFLNSFWRTKLDGIIDEGALSSDEFGEFKQRLQHYVVQFTHVLFKTNLPRFPVPLKILAEVFAQQDSPFIIRKPEKYTFACIDYVLKRGNLPQYLDKVLEEVHLNKYSLFEEIIKQSYAKSLQFYKFYGVIAITDIVRTLDPHQIAHFLELYERSYPIAQSTIRSKVDEPAFMKLSGDSFQFIDKRYQWFFAAKYLQDNLDENSVVPDAFFHEILIEPKYYDLLEYLNRDSIGIRSSPFINAEYRIRRKIITNLVDNGLEEILLKNIHHILAYENNNDHRRIVHVYRALNGNKVRSNHIWGMTNFLQSSSSNDYSVPHTVKSSEPRLTILEKLVEFDMLRSLKTLQGMGIWVKTTDSRCKQYYLKLLHCAVTQPIQNQGIIQLLVNKSPFKISTLQWNQLLYDTVYYVGAECKVTANYLVTQGAQPNLKLNGRTLIHAAVRWNSPYLLRFVIDKLKAPIIDTEKIPVHTLFEAALDANPSPFYTANGWWDMMLYLVPRLEKLSPYPFNRALLESKINIPSEELSSPWFKLMTSADVISKPSDGDLSKIMCQAIYEDSASYNHLKEFAASTSASAWPLSENTLSVRRIAVMRQLQQSHAVRISPLETMIYYRGVSALSPSKQEKYQKLILLLWKREQPFMDASDGSRILGTLCRTIRNENDYRTMIRFLKATIARTVTFERVYQVLNELQLKLQDHQLKILFPLFERLTQQRIDYHPPSADMQIVIGDNRRIMQRIYEASPSNQRIDIGDSDELISQCLLPRRVSSFRCLFSRDDINMFSSNLDAGDLSRLQINSHLFVRTLWNLEFTDAETANQIIRFVVNLSRQQRSTQLMVGNEQGIVGEILRAGNMQQFRQTYRTRAIVHNLLHSTSTYQETISNYKLSSRSIALNIATLVPLFRELHETIVICLDFPSSHTDCTQKSTKLVVAFASYFGSSFMINHIPWMLFSFVTIIENARVSVVPSIVRENLLLFRHLGLKYGKKAGLGLFTAVDVAVDVYNIVQASNNLIQCQLGSKSCSIKDQVSNAISLIFSGISIIGTGVLLLSGVGAVPIVLFNLVRVILEAIAEGIVDVVYYSNTYHTDAGENMLIFLRKLIFLPPTARIQRLQRRMDWIESQKKDALQFLTKERNIVAYATGLGYLTDDGVQANWGSIDMSKSSRKHTEGLSRVIPDLNSTYIGMCLPLQNTTESYDSDVLHQQTVETARYKCDNTFVIAENERWQRERDEKLSIVYNLKYINEGNIIGSTNFNNMFLIVNGTSMLNVSTSVGNVTNTFIMQSTHFCGTINLQYNGDYSNIIDFATVQWPYTTRFRWFRSAFYGRVQFSHDCFVTINSHISVDQNSTIFVHGRLNRADSFMCEDTSTLNSHHNIIIDGNGGFSRYDVDNIKFCKTSFLRPFTTIQGSRNPNMTYTTFLKFPEGSISALKLPEEVELFAQIITHETKFIVIFSSRSLLASLEKVAYDPIMQDLKLKLWYTDTKILTLLINRYRSTSTMSSPQNGSDVTKWDEVNAVFIDSYSGLVLYPSIGAADNLTTWMTIEKFVALVSVNDSRTENAFLKYEEIMGLVKNKNISLTVKFHAPDGDNNFIFGNNDDDRFVIDKNITLVAGNNGFDVYILTEQSPKCVFINNKATDKIFDLLIVEEVVCDSLHTRSKHTYRLCNASIESDLILICSISGKNPKTTYVVLQRYLTDFNHQHLEIYYRKELYTFIPDTWIDFSKMTVDSEGRDSMNRLAPFFSFRREGYNMIILTSQRQYAVIHSTDMTNRFEAYKSGQNIFIGKQYLSSAFRLIVLQDFFSTDSKQYSVAEEWTNFEFFLITDMSNNSLPTILTAGDVLDLFLDSIIEIDTLGEDTTDNLIHEYYVNVNQSEGKREIVIDHNNATFGNAADCLGVLIVVGAQPKDVTVVWNSIYDTTLEFHIKNVTISVEKWADGVRKRLHRIEFINSIDKPVIMKNLDTIKLIPQTSNDFNSFEKHFREEDEYLRELTLKLADAQEQYELRTLIGWDDKVQLIRCVGISYAGYIAFRPIYKLLGFVSLLSQMEFMVNNCIRLFSKERLDMLSHIDAYETLRKLFQLNKLIDEILDVDYGFLADFSSLTDKCWNLFKQTLYNYADANNAVIKRNPKFGLECRPEA